MQIAYKKYDDPTLLFREVSEEKARSLVNIATIPKGGTYLLLKILHKMGVEYKFGSNQSGHLSHMIDEGTAAKKMRDPLRRLIGKSPEKFIVTVRDPRDFFVSYIDWVDRAIDRQPPKKWYDLTFDQKLLDGIKQKPPGELESLTNWPWHIGNLKYANELMKRNYSNVLIVRFEDIVGYSEGRCSEEQYLSTLRRISEFTGANLTEEKIKEIAPDIIGGNGVTYAKQKKIGRWKECFSAKHIKAFDKRYTSLLLEMGYEKDPKWAKKILKKL